MNLAWVFGAGAEQWEGMGRQMHTKIELEKMVKARRGCLARRGLFN
jgi:hypothetical protein